MLTRINRVAASVVVLVAFGIACAEEGGACVSDPVQTFGLRVYCQNDFDRSECSSWDRQEVNGARWTFYGGQTCGDRDLEEGSNPWP